MLAFLFCNHAKNICPVGWAANPNMTLLQQPPTNKTENIFLSLVRY